MTIPVEWTRLRPPGRCLSDLALDQLAAGQAPGALAAEAWRAHLRQCAACEGRRHDLDVQRAALLARRPALVLPAQGRGHKRPRLAWGLGALAVAAAAVVLVIHSPAPPPPGRAAVRVKGGFGLEVFVKRAAGRVEALSPDAVAAEGDALRFRVSTDAGGVVTIVGVDASGAVTSYDPAPPALPVLAPGERRLLDGSIVLDGSIGHERLLALLCGDREQAQVALFQLTRALAAAPASAPPPPAGCRQAVFPFQKVARP